jgi:hypothetical protein
MAMTPEILVSILKTYRDRIKAGADVDAACDFIIKHLDSHIKEATDNPNAN